MSDRFLAVSLALCLALPLCLSLDEDLFGWGPYKAGHQQVENLLQDSPPDPLRPTAAPLTDHDEVWTGEVARRFPVLALDATVKQSAVVEEPISRSGHPGSDIHWPQRR